jgi:ligand-binding sensor domain-containing protein
MLTTTRRTKTKTKRLPSGKIPSAAVVITMMASIVLAVWQIPTATASSLEVIRVSREISAPVDQVWGVVSNILFIIVTGISYYVIYHFSALSHSFAD